MNRLLTSTSGIDTEIQALQEVLYDSLANVWNQNIEGYGRIYRTLDKNGKTIPRIYIGDKDYKEVLFDDNTAGSMFFIDDETHDTEDGFLYTSEVKCVFMLNLEAIMTDVERADSEAQRDVIEIIRQQSQGHSIKRVEKGVSNALRGFDQSQIKYLDRHPNHCFSVVIELSYDVNDKCN